MAEGGYKQAESFRLESDDFHEYPCLPCAKDNRNVAAIKYCVECNENICGKCVSAHNKYAGMKGHQISDTIKTNPGQGDPGLPSQRCDIHAGKLVDVYCADHDFVGCSTCIAIEHRWCKDVKFIPDVASTLQTSIEIQDLTSEMQALETRISTLKEKKAKFVHSRNQDKERILDEIRLSREKVNARLDQMQEAMLDEVDTFFQTKQEGVDAVMGELNCFADEIADVHTALGVFKNKNESALFVEVKKSKSVLRSNADKLKRLEDSHLNVHSGFYLSREIENILPITSSFGFLSDSPAFSTDHVSFECSVRLQSDHHRCDISSICQTKSGEIALTDKSNRKIKLFTSNFSKKDYTVTTTQPNNICEVDNNRLAVTLRESKCVQLLSTNPLKLEDSIRVGDKCRGIQYSEGLLYVGCGGLKDNREGPGHIEIYDMEGKLLRTYYDSIVCPWYISIPNKNIETSLAVSDLKGENIIMIDFANNKSTPLKLQHIIKPSGCYTVTASRHMLICGFGSNNIVFHSEGQERELLKENDGIVRPRAISYDEHISRLIVSLDSSDIIKVFTFTD